VGVALATAGVYTITPAAGLISGGTNQHFVLCFSPVEVEDVARKLVCRFPVLEKLLPEAATHIIRQVEGKVGLAGWLAGLLTGWTASTGPSFVTAL
jgi:hypothetical protein